MKNKILAAGVLTITFVLAGNAYAVGQNSEQVQTGTNTGTQTQQQTQQKLQDGSGTGNQVQNQNQIQNQGETNQIQNREQEGTQSQKKSGSAVAQQRKSQVANAVQEMLQVAERNGGIGQQVRIIAQNQEKLEASLQKVQSRGGFVKFFVGPNYGEINNVKKILEQNREQIKRLNQVKNQLVNQGDQQTLTQQIQTLEQANLEIENLLGTAQKGFSLLGWMFRLFDR